MARNIIINPVLTFKRKAQPEGITARGKTADKIKPHPRSHRVALSAQVKELSGFLSPDLAFSDTTHLIAKMQEDSQAPTWTPTDIFSLSNGCEIIAPAYKGYLIEIHQDNLNKLADKILNSSKDKEMVDISRLESIDLFDTSETLRGREIEQLWAENDIKEYKDFTFWLKPFKNIDSRISLIDRLKNALQESEIRLGDPEFSIGSNDGQLTRFIDLVLENYLHSGSASLSLEVDSKESLERILSSGTIYRIEPSTPLTITSSPGAGQEPTPKTIDQNSPVVVIIDGGVNASSYIPLQKVKIEPLVGDNYANSVHGNKVASLVCHAHAWNNNRPLPELDCTFISAQAICKNSSPKHPSIAQLIGYLRKVAKETVGISRVWNLSFNELVNSISSPEVSYLGGQINKIAREYNILPVISVGNTNHNSIDTTLSPPADCECALTVSGRQYIDASTPLGTKSTYSLAGPGPAGMKKPDLSWYSTLRMLGGNIDNGTSFSTPLVSSLAAHTFANVKNATPDLVKALLINRADLNEHDHGLGWGTPDTGESLPWHCPEGTVTLAWTSKLEPGQRYYWNNIPIPDELTVDGKIRGVISLTAILRPMISEHGGDNYFATRIETSLQTKKGNGKTASLVGSMKESTEKEAVSREELSKWSPVRHLVKTHPRGTAFKKDSVRLYARIYARDLYQFDVNHHSELGEQEVAFVLTFKAFDNAPGLYNSMRAQLKQDVESALVEQQLEIDGDVNS